ncbi:MAG: tRNA lysidine(34) synthetase TilS, partial [Bacteroidota bacterium]|nr:tRNA lysidine(34) synthetase TilS [Bacteroidota bacterium]
KRFETREFAEAEKLSIQVAARRLRYGWFNELVLHQKAVIENYKGVYLATAHHLNDNVETLLMHFFKGTGIKGLAGIPAKNQSIVRPLLFATKKDLLAYADQYQIPYREDASNRSEKYVRNYFRNSLIPSIKEVFPAVEENLAQNLNRFIQANELYQQAVDVHKAKLMVEKGTEVHIPVLKLLKSTPLETILFEILSPYGFSSHQLPEAIQLMKSESGKYIASLTHRLIRHRDWLIITPVKDLLSGTILVEGGVSEIRFPNGKLCINPVVPDKDLKYGDPSTIFVDAKSVRFPLILRKWKQGDYFYPFGLRKPSGAPAKKKLSRFFVDQKLSISEKERVWVLESDRRIVWIMGVRMDERFKVGESTRNILKLHLVRSENVP